MKHVLITGADSYIGAWIAAHLSAASFDVREMDMRGEWDRGAFCGYDTVIHVAGIAHQRETDENADAYYAVNRDLAVETARAAKACGVGQFIFMSSMSVYGLTTGHITADTQPAPVTHYGKSKWQAEQQLAKLCDDTFRVAVLRPPMIYGRGCRGNYPRLAALALKLPLFPAVQNRRSMLYIETLCAFVQCLVQSGEGGLFFPQNRDYVTTCDMVSAIRRCRTGRAMLPVPGFGWLVGALAKRVGVVGKVFGSLTYDHAMSAAYADAGQLSFEETIQRTEAAK